MLDATPKPATSVMYNDYRMACLPLLARPIAVTIPVSVAVPPNYDSGGRGHHAYRSRRTDVDADVDVSSCRQRR
jgi:hypothetical protein